MIGARFYSFDISKDPQFEINRSESHEEQLMANLNQLYWIHRSSVLMFKKGKKSPAPPRIEPYDADNVPICKNLAKLWVDAEWGSEEERALLKTKFT